MSQALIDECNKQRDRQIRKLLSVAFQRMQETDPFKVILRFRKGDPAFAAILELGDIFDKDSCMSISARHNSVDPSFWDLTAFRTNGKSFFSLREEDFCRVFNEPR